MAHAAAWQQHDGTLGRRTLIKAAAVAAGAMTLAPLAASADEPKGEYKFKTLTDQVDLAENADRDYGPDAPPVHYPDPDVVAVTPAFNKYIQGNSAIRRLWTGALWAEGPA